MKILVVDVGGTSVKIWGPSGARLAKLRTGPKFPPEKLVEATLPVVEGEACEAISLGYPGKIVHGRPWREPWNLGNGWVDFDFVKALGRPVRIMNDAAMQALGGYRDGCMLFMGLGTSVGGALIVDGVVVPLELGNIPYSRRMTVEDALSKRGLRRRGRAQWSRAVLTVLPKLQNAFMADYIVLGGGNARLLSGNIPSSVRLGGNQDAFLGGVRMWKTRGLTTAHWFDPDQEIGAESPRGAPPSAD